MGLRKYFVGGFLVLGLLVVGFLFLIRSCLSQYDERSAVAPALLIEKDGKAVLFSLVKYEKATSYSQRGGFISKSVSTTWFIQTNDPATAAPLGQQKIKHQSDIKHWPVEMLGSTPGLAWAFIGEIMAFDPFTLEKKVDKAIIEAKNPGLKDKLPPDRRYYRFNRSDATLIITANDGIFWKLNPSTLLATQQEEDESRDPTKAAMKRLEALREQNRKAQDSLYRNHNRSKSFFTDRESLTRERDSIYVLMSLLRKKETDLRRLDVTISNFASGSTSYQQIKINQDTANGQWLGLYSKSELEKIYDNVSWTASYDEAARRQLFSSVYFEDKYGSLKINKDEIKPVSPPQYFLQGGFLLDKQTALPIHLQNPGGYLIIHKDKIGNEGKILVSRIENTGKLLWTVESGLTEWDDWIITRDRLITLGADQPALSGNDCNVLSCIDLATGKPNRYDYFTNK